MSAFGPKWTFRGGITRKTLLSVKRPSSSGGEKVPHFVKESAPKRVSLQNHVIAAFKCDRSARRGYPTRSDAPHQTAAEHRYGNGAQGSEWSRMEQIGHVYLVKRATQPRGMS